uniref:Uncharacterized protein n=1 Tax=Physcomitrium patens TaxID=3218 RepID=A0A2K1IZR1_PHYPA|nr:hypothetical protein PHYPA_022670 [Physcomitrium patens]
MIVDGVGVVGISGWCGCGRRLRGSAGAVDIPETLRLFSIMICVFLSNGSHLGRLGADLEAELLLSCHLGSLDVEGFSVILLV